MVVNTRPMPPVLDFFKLLGLYGFDPTQGKVVLVRHTLNEETPPIADYVRRSAENLAEWQCVQRRDNNKGDNRNLGRFFWGCDVVVSFVAPTVYGGKGAKAKFVGLFHNKSKEPKKFNDSQEGVSPELAELFRDKYPGKNRELLHLFDFRRDSRFEELENRVIINWDWGTWNWVQVYNPGKPKGEVLEIRAKDYADRVLTPFPGMGDVLMSFDEMAEMASSPLDYSDWHAALKSSKGVYLITYEGGDASGIKMYVGAAYGDDGILGRWRAYSETPHGGNVKLKALLKKNKNAYRQFKFSILQQLPEAATQREAIACEKLWKNKLGSRAFGLNSN